MRVGVRSLAREHHRRRASSRFANSAASGHQQPNQNINGTEKAPASTKAAIIKLYAYAVTLSSRKIGKTSYAVVIAASATEDARLTASR
jgi:hypothetical protein